MYDGRRWTYSEIGPYHDISTHLVSIYENLLPKDPMTDPIRHGAIQRLIAKLKNVHFKEALMKECLYMFYQPTFLAKLDRNMDLVCFRNGVLDLSDRIFRGGSSDDNISLFIDCDYPTLDASRRITEFIAFREDMIVKRKNHVVSHTP
jgi:hypothetical protein